jgi:TonB-dependent SusC/RagA subfamily outer membrane receptor
MQFRIILTCLLLGSVACAAQDLYADEPIYFVDSVRTETGMNGLNPENIGMISVVKGKKLEALYGSRAANGVIYIETKPFAHERYKKMFSEMAPGYAAALKQYGSDSSFQYILDGVLLKDPVDPMLTALEKKAIADITVISQAVLQTAYKVKNKQAGVVIKSK